MSERTGQLVNSSFDIVFRQTDQYGPSHPIESSLGQLGQAGQAKTITQHSLPSNLVASSPEADLSSGLEWA